MKKLLTCLIILLMLGGVFGIVVPNIAYADPPEGAPNPLPPPDIPDD